MTLHAASREALGLAENRLGEVLGDAGTDPSVVGEELLSVVDLLSREVGLRRAAGDGSSDPQVRVRLVRSVLDGKVSDPTLTVLDTAVSSRWSSPRELLDGLESLGRSALLTSAETTGNLDSVERQLFDIARIVGGSAELDRALSEQTAPADAKRGLVRNLFGDKVDPITRMLTERAVVRQRGRGASYGLDELVKLAAERRERSVARVTTATELTDEQQSTLAGKLRAIYGRQIAVHQEIDPNLGGGLVIRVGDEVIDGSSAGRIATLRRQLAG
ncbi:F0F1 ATP synthase subunit delta [Amycolatopsis antarctica]|uniref:ATP synthase subunit delta n=1 Tax=Amycolatopsis antarctica TaxID=1854586 RepID=A0A263D5P4_9PSEU|nr:F0F1 ATP synthase subunit delta [Amycolatopsis antarctica]OZM73832.1 F0F1 ATP synthase subunit delta [Amycolatopsis antarctica]